MRGMLVALSVAAPLLGSGCIDAVVAPDRTLPEQRGTQVGIAGGVDEGTAFAWAADGGSIFYRSSGDAPSLAVIDVAAGAPVGLVSAWAGHRDIRPAPDGRSLYFVADTGSAGVPIVFRLPLTEGAPVGLGRTVGDTATRQSDGSAVLPTPRPDTAALVVAPDSVVLDGPAQRVFIADGCERLVAFSPEGSLLLCQRTTGASAVYRILDVPAASFTSVPVVGPDDGEPLAIAWSAEGIRTLFLGASGFGIHDVTTAASRTVAPPPDHGFVAGATYAALSADGQLAAYWVHTCVDPGGPGECALGQSVLHVVDLVTLEDRVAAVVTAATAASRVAFAPDAAQLAYVIEGTLYRVPVP